MSTRVPPSGLAIVVASVVVVIVAWGIGIEWGADAFVVACLVGSIFAGLIIARAE